MTLFGKFVFTFFGVVLAFGIFYGVMSYVKHDSDIAILPVPVATTTQDIASSTDATTTIATSTSLVATSTTKKDDTKLPFPEILARGGEYKCLITQVMGTISSDGVVYIHKDLVRAEFSVAVMDKKINSTLIARDGYMYTWTDTATSTGSKTKMPTVDRNGKAVSTNGVRTWNGDQVKDYTCSPWTPVDTMFDIPKSMTFTAQ